jgi:hypothetical protein
MPVEKKQIPSAPFKGLYLDGVTVPGGLSKAENVIILPDGTAERRPFERTLADTETCQASRGTKEVFELLKNDGTRYIYADIDNSETYTSAFGAEEVEHFATWTPTSGWTYGSSKWTHSAGTTALVATGESAIVAATKYRVVLDVTFPTIYGTGSNWTYAHTDTGSTYTTQTGGTLKIWLNTWTHASGATTALTADEDFDVVAGESYVVKLYVTHTSGTGLSVYLGGNLLGVIATSGYTTFIARYVTNTTGLRFVPSSDWVGSIEKTFPRVPNILDKTCSVIKLITPDAANIPANYDYEASPHEPDSWYNNGAELLYYEPVNWYAEAAAAVSQSLAITLGATAAGTITASGVYSYDVTATNTTALTITPTTAFTGSVNSASVKKMTQATAATRCKVIGGTVTGTTDYETTWGNILTDLETGDTVHPQWTAMQDRAFRCDGVNPNYWFEDATYHHTLGVPSPADAPVTANTTGGEITAGDYNVYYTYVKKYSNNYVVEGNPSPASHTTVTDSAITINVIACTDLDVTHIRIYRTLYGESGSFAYFSQEVKNATATITMTVADDNIRSTLTTLEFNHDVPPLGKFVLGAGSRLWLVDTNGTLHWSVLDQPELMPSMNYQTFDPKDGDEMMGLCPLRKHLLVFKRKRTWLLDMFSESVSDDGVAALAKDVVSSNYGCIATGSIQPVGTDAAIWLSHAGFILYNGGSIKNISGGGIDADGNMMPSRIQDVINDFMADGAEHFIDSAYHTARQLYHVNFLTRNAGGTAITAQRHFVYNLQSDSWSEYVYRDSDGDKMYETNFAMAHDSLGNEVILIPYISSTTGTVTYVYQGEYDFPPETLGTAVELLDSTGAGGTALDAPLFSFADSSNNVYVIAGDEDSESNINVFKITDEGVASLLISTSTIKTALGTGDNYPNLYPKSFVQDDTNECFYVMGKSPQPALGGFTGLEVSPRRGWQSITTNPFSQGDVYALYYNSGTTAGVYKQTDGTGEFSLVSALTGWSGVPINLCISPTTGELYLTTSTQLYVSDGTSGFALLDNSVAIDGNITHSLNAITIDSDGSVYVNENGSTLMWKRINGSGAFQTFTNSVSWNGFCTSYSGDIYGVANDGDIYKNWVALGKIHPNYPTARWLEIAVDINDNIYVTDGSSAIKVSIGGTEDLVTADSTSRNWSGLTASPTTVYATDRNSPTFSGDIYTQVGGGSQIYWILKSTYAGACTLIASATILDYVGDSIENGIKINSDGSSLFYIKETHISESSSTFALHRVSNPGSSQTDAVYYSAAYSMNDCNFGGMDVYGDNLYILHTGTTNYQLTKITDTGAATASASLIDTGIATSYSPTHVISISDTEHYILCSGSVQKLEYTDGAWSNSSFITISGTNSEKSFFVNSSGQFTITTGNYVYKYNSAGTLIDTTSNSSVTECVGVSNLNGSESLEAVVIVCGYTSNNVYKIYPEGYWGEIWDTIIDVETEPTMYNTMIHITSNYTDLGIPNEKRITRAYLDIDCKYPGCGAFYIEPDYKINYATHAHGEISEPSGAVSMRPFQHYGHQAWVYTNSSFDDNSEQWQPTRLDVGTKGTAFRYTIRAGDVSTNVTGTMRIRPPKVMVQVKEVI